MAIKYKTKAKKKTRFPKGKDYSEQSIFKQKKSSVPFQNGANIISIYPELIDNDCYVHLDIDGNSSISNLDIAGFEFKIKNVQILDPKGQNKFYKNSTKLLGNYLSKKTKISKLTKIEDTKVNELINDLKESNTHVIINNFFSNFVTLVNNVKDGVKLVSIKIPQYNDLIRKVFADDEENLNLRNKLVMSNFKNEKFSQDKKNIILFKLQGIEQMNEKSKTSCITDVVFSNSLGDNIFKVNNYSLNSVCEDEWVKKQPQDIIKNSTFELDYFRESKKVDDYYSSYSCEVLDSKYVECTCLYSMGGNAAGITTCTDGDTITGIYTYTYNLLNDDGTIVIQLESGQKITGIIDYVKSTSDIDEIEHSDCSSFVSVPYNQCNYFEVGTDGNTNCTINKINLKSNPSMRCRKQKDKVGGADVKSRPKKLG